MPPAPIVNHTTTPVDCIISASGAAVAITNRHDITLAPYVQKPAWNQMAVVGLARHGGHVLGRRAVPRLCLTGLALLLLPEDRVPVIFVSLSDRLLTLASAVIFGGFCLRFSRGFSLCVGLRLRRGFFLRVLFRLGLFVVRYRLSYSPSSWALDMTPKKLCLAINEDAFGPL